MFTFKTEPIVLDERVPGVRLVIGRHNGVMQVFDLYLTDFDVVAAEFINRRDDLHAFFERSGMLKSPKRLEEPASETRMANRQAGKKPYARPEIRPIPPSDPRAQAMAAELDGLPTPMPPPPLEKERQQ
jgi:hypothetical protein